MTEDVELQDAMDIEKEPGACFGTWDPKFDECTSRCRVSEKCRVNTQNAGKPAPAAPVTEEAMELPEMDPYDYLVECLKGRFDVQSGEKNGVRRCRFRKDGKVVGHVTVLASGKSQFVTTNSKLQLDEGMDSTKQAGQIAQAILMA